MQNSCSQWEAPDGMGPLGLGIQPEGWDGLGGAAPQQLRAAPELLRAAPELLRSCPQGAPQPPRATPRRATRRFSSM